MLVRPGSFRAVRATVSGPALGANLWDASAVDVVDANGTAGAWDAGTGVFSNGAIGSPTVSYPRLRLLDVLTAGTVYRVQMTLAGDVQHIVNVFMNGAGGTTIIHDGATSIDVEMTGGAGLDFLISGNSAQTFSVTLSNVSIREVL